MKDGINISSEDLANLMVEFGEEIVSMKELLDEVKEKTNDISSIWDGEDSEQVMNAFSEFRSQFDSINESNENYLNFLDKVISSYTSYDQGLSNNITDSNNVFDINN